MCENGRQDGLVSGADAWTGLGVGAWTGMIVGADGYKSHSYCLLDFAWIDPPQIHTIVRLSSCFAIIY